MAYTPRLKTALTGARRCTTWATSSPPRDTAMAWPAGSRAMLATTMPSYRFSISRAPRWGRRSPAISEAAVSTSRAASLGHTDRSQLPGSSRTTATLASRPAVATSTMNHRSRGGSPLKVIPPLGSSAPGRAAPAPGRAPSVPCSQPPGSSFQAPAVQRRDAQLLAVQSIAAQLLAAQLRASQASSAQLRAAQLRAARSPELQARWAQLRAAQLRASQSTAPTAPIPLGPVPLDPAPPGPAPSRAAARRSPHDHWRAAQPADGRPVAAHRLAAQTLASHCWAAQLLDAQLAAVQPPLGQGWAVQAAVSSAPGVSPGRPVAGAQRSPSAPPARQSRPWAASGSRGAPARPTVRSGNRSALAGGTVPVPSAAPRSRAPAPDPGCPMGSALPVRAALMRSGPQSGCSAATRAAAPATTAVDIEVPDPRKWWSPTRADGLARSMVEPGARRPTRPTPGATRSGLAGEVGAAAAPGRHRPGAVDGADGEHVRVQPGGLGPAAPVAGGGDHGDPVGPEPLDRLGEGRGGRVVGRGAERDVEDPEVEAVAGRVGELEGGPDLAEGGGGPVGPGHLEVDQVGAGGDPGRPAGLAAPGDQPGHEGAVAVGVGEAPLAGQVGAGHHPPGQVAAGRDPGVEHPDPDADVGGVRGGGLPPIESDTAARGCVPDPHPNPGTCSGALTWSGRSAAVTARAPGEGD